MFVFVLCVLTAVPTNVPTELSQLRCILPLAATPVAKANDSQQEASELDVAAVTSSLNMSVGSACDQLVLAQQQEATSADLAIVPGSESSPIEIAFNKNAAVVVLGNAVVPESPTTPTSANPLKTTTTPRKNLIKENIEKIKEHVNNSDNYARTEIEQIHRPSGVHTIGRQISSQVSKDESKKEEKRELNVEKGIVSRAKEGNFRF